MSQAHLPLRHRPLQTVLPYPYLGRERILAVTWDRDDRAVDGARVVAVMPVAGAPIPIGLPIVCVAVSVGLASGLNLTAIAEGADWVRSRFTRADPGLGGADSIGALARRLIAVEAGGASAAAYALECRPAPDPEGAA